MKKNKYVKGQIFLITGGRYQDEYVKIIDFELTHTPITYRGAIILGVDRGIQTTIPENDLQECTE